MDKEMMKALEADGEKLRQLTGEDHGPQALAQCPECGGEGYFLKRITVYEHGCGFPHDDTDEIKCEACDGTGVIVVDYADAR